MGMPVNIQQRLRLAGRALLKGEPSIHNRGDIPAITPEEVREAKSFFPLGKFFIFGHARSGTTLLTRLVRLHPQVHCNYQAHFFTRSNRWNRGSDLSPVVLRAVSDYIMERDARRVGKDNHGCLVGDKSPNSLLNGEAVHLLWKVYPDARLVFIVRDGRDAVVSHRFQAFVDRPHHLSKESRTIHQDFIQDPEPFLAGRRSIFTGKELRQAAKGWVNNLIETDREARELLDEQYFHLRYEDLLARPSDEMNRLWYFLGVDSTLPGVSEALQDELGENPDADWQRQKAANIASSLNKGERGSWHNLFTPRDRQIFKDVAGETLINWGYEQDLDW
jgi:hypothetical protein